MKYLLPLLALSGLAPLACAATHAVLPGESIQAKIDAAAPGDIIAIFGGTYSADVTINKAVRLVEVDGQDVNLTGDVMWNSVTNAPPFEGFTVGSSGGRGLWIHGTTGLIIKNVDTRQGWGVGIFGSSSVSIIGGYHSRIQQDGGSLDTSLTQIIGNFDTTQNCQKTIAFRTTIGADAMWNSTKSWFGYSKSRAFSFRGSNSRVFLIGSEIDRQNLPSWNTNPGNITIASGIQLYGGTNNTFVVANCTVKNIKDQTSNGAWGLYIGDGNYGYISNNYIQLSPESYGSFSDSGFGILSYSPNCQILNNIIVGGQGSIKAPYGAIARENHLSGYKYYSEYGGIVQQGYQTGDPLFVVGQPPLLQPSSPCINAGINDPVFNDLDGTRNDIGPSGGCMFDPQGWTTTKPVVISFDLAPQQLLKGVDTQVNVSNGKAVAQP